MAKKLRAAEKVVNFMGLHPLIISTCLILVAILIAMALRKIVRTIIKDELVLLKQVLLEIIATAELCTCCYELIIVADNYGVAMYGLYLFLLTIWWSLSWDEATACPYNHMEDVVQGSKPIKNAAILIFAQVMAGLCVFRYVSSIWAIELAATHQGRASARCEADLKVHMLIGALIEFVATCMCRLASRAISDSKFKYAGPIDALFSTLLVIAAFNYSGGYFNPALATSLKFNCAGNSFTEHMVVYWAGASLGALASVFLYRVSWIKNMLVWKTEYKFD